MPDISENRPTPPIPIRWIVALGVASCVLGWWLRDPTYPVLPAAHMADLIQLARPNSEHFSVAQATARKMEILKNHPSGPVSDWHKPMYGTTFSIHVHLDDSVDVDHFNEQLPASGMRESLNWLLGRAPSVYQQRIPNASLEQLEAISKLAGYRNEPATVIVTSDRPLSESKKFPTMLDFLFNPWIQLHYVGAPESSPIR